MRRRPTRAEIEPAALALLQRHGSAIMATARRFAATLEDAVGEQRRPNMPGTTDRPNWSLPLPVPVEDLPGHPLVQTVARTLAAGVSGN